MKVIGKNAQAHCALPAAGLYRCRECMKMRKVSRTVSDDGETVAVVACTWRTRCRLRPVAPLKRCT